MCSMSFSTFHKVRDELVLEITLGPDTPTAPPQAFYSSNTQAPPAQSYPLAMVSRVKDRAAVMIGVAEVAATTLQAKATRDTTARPTLPQPSGPPSTILGMGPSTCTLVQLRG
jgi:hypothetical protein